MAVYMKNCFWRLAGVTALTAALAGCGGPKESKETTDALQKASALEAQQEYQEANSVLVDALQARETVLRPATPATDPDEANAETKKIEADPEILKMERAQITIYIHLERADLAALVYNDILNGNPGDTILTDELADKDAKIRAGAVGIMALIHKPEIIPALTAATKDSDQDVRRSAVSALGAIQDPAAVDPLIAALKDSYWFVRSESAQALGQQHDARAVKPLLDVVGDDNTVVQENAESSLLEICQDAKGVSADDLAARLTDPNPKIMLIAALGLNLLKDHRAVPVFMKMIQSTDTTTRLEGLRGLGEAGDPSAIPTFRETLKETDVNVRGWSVIGLDNLGDKDSLPALRAIAADEKETPSVRSRAELAVSHLTGKTPAPTPSGP